KIRQGRKILTITQLLGKFLNNWMAIRRKSSLRSSERSWEGGVGKMACRRFVEDDFNRGELSEELRELLSPDQRGDGGEDDPADLARDADGVWRQIRDRDRAIAWASDSDHIRLLATGGQDEDPSDDLY
ncbi:hypothetical protein HZB93_00005, partial [Candidatus Falkowbacteria bacterium]|nr:hypothetical protein [Candidatus Falkowbacteria bacterium]